MKTNQLLAVTALGLSALFGNLAHAQASTGSLSGWSVLGDAIAQNGAITLTTAYLDGGADAAHNLSGTSAAYIVDVETAAGVAPFALDLPPDHYAYEGSLVSQSFAATAGQMLSFDWAFTTWEDLYLDHAFVVIGGNVFTLATTAQPGGSSQSFKYTVGATGPLSLAFGVVDTDDVDGVSLLRVSSLQLSTVTAPVPEPSTWALFAGGLGLIGWFGRRRTRG
jgi:hypothetical protein